MEEKKGAALALVSSQPQPSAMTVTGNIRISNMDEAIKLADRLANARGFVPAAMSQNGNAVLAAILTGAELGFGPMESLRSFDMIEGKVSMKSEVMLSRAHRFGHRTRWLRTDNDGATISITLCGQATPEAPISFTMDDAKRAGLAGKGNWSKHPAAMLRARAASAAIRAHCPEVLGAGVYESESGELTEGAAPPANYVDATIVETKQAPADEGPPIPRAVKDVNDAPMLKRYCEKYGPAIVKANNAEKCVARGEQLDVPAAVVREWLGIVEAPPPDYDPES